MKKLDTVPSFCSKITRIELLYCCVLFQDISCNASHTIKFALCNVSQWLSNWINITPKYILAVNCSIILRIISQTWLSSLRDI